MKTSAAGAETKRTVVPSGTRTSALLVATGTKAILKRGRKMEHRQVNPNYSAIAEELIATEPELAYIKNSSVRIAYLESDSCKKDGKEKLVLGECEKVAPKNMWAIAYDFTITLYRNNLVGMTESQIRIVMFHELLHVAIEPDGDGGELYSVRKHDLEDFKVIIDRYGTDWAKGSGAKAAKEIDE